METRFYTHTHKGPASRHGGQAVIIATVFFLVISLSVVIGIAAPVLADAALGRTLDRSKDTYFLAEALVEDVVYRYRSSKQVSATESLTLAGHTASAEVTDIVGGKRIISTGNVSDAIRKVQTDIVIGEGASFNFGVQTDVGGIVMENTSSVNGNVFSNGSVVGANSNIVRGDIISAGPEGLISGSHATGTAYAHTIDDSHIEGDAYYQVLQNNPTILGTEYPNSPDQATTSLPISDAQIEVLKTDAEGGGEYSGECPYSVSTDVTIGPLKIPCDFEIRNDPTITLGGNVWVEGDITVINKPTIRAASGLGAKSVALIADNPLNRTTSSQIDLRNSTTFISSGDGAYIVLISMNTSAEDGGAVPAIIVEQSSLGDFLVYASHGEVVLRNSVDLREVTAWRVRLQNAAEVTYETGLANLLFTSGPGGTFNIDTWYEVE